MGNGPPPLCLFWYNLRVGRTVLPFLLGVIAGIVLAEATRKAKEQAEEGDFDSVADRVSDRLERLESGLAALAN